MPKKTIDAARLLEFCSTGKQRAYIEAVLEHGSQRAAGKAMGVSKAAIAQAVNAVARRAAMQGQHPFLARDPNHDPNASLPDHQYFKGVSQLRKYTNPETGGVILEWVKSDTRKADLERMMDAVAEGFAPEIEGAAPPEPEKLSRPCETGLLNVYVMGDPHFGMYAWKKEAGADYNIEIAAERHYAAVDYLAENSKDAEDGLLLVLGDTFHADDDSSRTQSGNHLDTDTRFEKVYTVCVRALVRAVERLRKKHKRVSVVFMKGNHDPRSSIVLAEHFKAFYRQAKDVDVSGAHTYWYFRWGKTLLGSHHGHGAKFTELPLIMANDVPRDWAESTHRYFHCGHVHHSSKDKEHIVHVETHRTVAPNDAWHHLKGYRGLRGMQTITYCRGGGEKFRTVYTVDEQQRV
jgi:hypothetical protein